MTSTLYNGDCLDVMATLPDSSIDLVLTDPPYGTTSCKWDAVIPLPAMWAALTPLVGAKVPIVLFGAQPFTSALVMSRPGWYRHNWVWDKKTISNPMQAKQQPLRQHEDVLVFSRGPGPAYYPQKTDMDKVDKWTQRRQNKDAAAPAREGATGVARGKYPKTIQCFGAAKFEGRIVHPTQKPIALVEYLLHTYSLPGQTVLDFTMGSGTTGVACARTGRNFIGIEKDADYFSIAQRRIAEAEADAR